MKMKIKYSGIFIRIYTVNKIMPYMTSINCNTIDLPLPLSNIGLPNLGLDFYLSIILAKTG